MPLTRSAKDIEVRHEIRNGDIGALIRLHGDLYAREYGWDWTFEAFAAQTFGRLADEWDPARDRIWIAERANEIVGCIAILSAEGGAQLRWFLVHPSVRGAGLGRQLMELAMSFCRGAGYQHVFLWTMSSLTAAAHLYRSYGFQLTHQETTEKWGGELTEERYDLDLTPRAE